jgi:hypothetical protein
MWISRSFSVAVNAPKKSKEQGACNAGCVLEVFLA